MPNLKDLLPPPPWEGPPFPEAFLRAFKLTPSRIALAQRVNNLIRLRTKYGKRFETVESPPAYVLSWSNGSAAWWGPNYAYMKRGASVDIDANEVLVQGATKADLKAILGYLEPLPLYAASFEAKERGFFDPRRWLEGLYQDWLHRGEDEEI